MKIRKQHLRQIIRSLILESMVKLPKGIDAILLDQVIGILIQEIKTLYEKLPEEIVGQSKRDPKTIYNLSADYHDNRPTVHTKFKPKGQTHEYDESTLEPVIPGKEHTADLSVKGGGSISGRTMTGVGREALMQGKGRVGELFFLTEFFKIAQDPKLYFTNNVKDLEEMGRKYTSAFLSDTAHGLDQTQLFMKTVFRKLGFKQGLNMVNYERPGDYRNYTIVLTTEAKLRKLFNQNIKPYLLGLLDVTSFDLLPFNIQDSFETRSYTGTTMRDIDQFRKGMSAAAGEEFITSRLIIFLELLENLDVDYIISWVYHKYPNIMDVNIDQVVTILDEYDDYVNNNLDALTETDFDSELYFNLSSKIKDAAKNAMIITKYHDGKYDIYKKRRK